MSTSRRPYRVAGIQPAPPEEHDPFADRRLSLRLAQARRRLRRVSETLACVTSDLRDARNSLNPPAVEEDERDAG